jgi:thiol-disulfide isomerase/thioredoxin
MIAALTLALALLLTGCGGGSTAPTGAAAADAAAPAVIGAADRVAMPDLSGDTVSGGHDSLARYKGDVVVLNIWSSTCAPCRAEAAGLAKVARAAYPRGVRFLGIDTRDQSRAAAAAFEKRYGVTYPSFYDPPGRLILSFPRGSVNPQSYPATVVVDRGGRIAARALRPVGEEDLHAMIDPLLAEPAAG